MTSLAKVSGYFGVRNYLKNADRLRALAVNDGHDEDGEGAIAPTPSFYLRAAGMVAGDVGCIPLPPRLGEPKCRFSARRAMPVPCIERSDPCWLGSS